MIQATSRSKSTAPATPFLPPPPPLAPPPVPPPTPRPTVSPPPARPCGPQDLLGPRCVRVPRRQHGGHCQDDAEPGKGVMVGRARHGPRGQVVDVVTAEPQPGEKCHEANHQQDRAPAIGFLLLKQSE